MRNRLYDRFITFVAIATVTAIIILIMKVTGH